MKQQSRLKEFKTTKLCDIIKQKQLYHQNSNKNCAVYKKTRTMRYTNPCYSIVENHW